MSDLGFSTLNLGVILIRLTYSHRPSPVWKELPPAVDQLSEAGYQTRPLHSGGGEARHSVTRHSRKQVRF